MKDKYDDDLMYEYISSQPAADREAELARLLEENGYDIGELRELRKTYIDLGEIRIPRPRHEMTGGFYAMLESEKRKAAEWAAGCAEKRAIPAGRLRGMLSGLVSHGGSGRPAMRFAYALLFVLVGWTAAFWIPPGHRYEEKIRDMTTEVTEMKKMMMFSMLNRSSASERLQAIQYLKDIVSEDDEVMTAMLDVLERDPNVNVRLATLDALSLAARDERVKEGIIHNITIQDSPIIQLALVEFAVSMKDERAADALRTLLQKNDLNMTVRSRANDGLRRLS